VRDSTRTAAIKETLVTENSRAAAFIPTNGIVIPKRSEGSLLIKNLAPQKKKYQLFGLFLFLRCYYIPNSQPISVRNKLYNIPSVE
jgi:hypothetical protein